MVHRSPALVLAELAQSPMRLCICRDNVSTALVPLVTIVESQLRLDQQPDRKARTVMSRTAGFQASLSLYSDPRPADPQHTARCRRRIPRILRQRTAWAVPPDFGVRISSPMECCVGGHGDVNMGKVVDCTAKECTNPELSRAHLPWRKAGTKAVSRFRTRDSCFDAHPTHRWSRTACFVCAEDTKTPTWLRGPFLVLAHSSPKKQSPLSSFPTVAHSTGSFPELER